MCDLIRMAEDKVVSLSCVASKLKSSVLEYVRDSKSSGLLYVDLADYVSEIKMVRLCSTSTRSGSSSC